MKDNNCGLGDWLLILAMFAFLPALFLEVVATELSAKTQLIGNTVSSDNQFPFDSFYCEGFFYTVYTNDGDANCAHSWSYKKERLWPTRFVYRDKVFLQNRYGGGCGGPRAPSFHRCEVKAITYKDESVFFPNRENCGK